MKFAKTTIFVASLAMLTACAQPYSTGGGFGGGDGGGFNKQTGGSLLGGIGGAVAGAQFGGGTGQLVTTAAGTLLGAYLGSEVGASLDRADMTYYSQTSQRALETAQPGQSLPWSNPETGNYGTVTPQNYYQSDNGQYCREYQQAVTVGGRTETAYGTACRQPDGTWQIVS